MIDSGRPVPAGLFEGGGQEIVLLEEPVAEGTMVAVTLEPDGGSEQPTGTSSSEAGSLMGGKRDRLTVIPGGKEPTARPRVALRRGAPGHHRHPRRRARAGRALRPLRQDRVRPRLPRAAGLLARRGRGPGGVHHRLADGGHVHPRARQAPHVAAHARTPARRRPRAPRAAPPYAGSCRGAAAGHAGGGGRGGAPRPPTRRAGGADSCRPTSARRSSWLITAA